MTIFRPENAEGVREAVAWAAAEEVPLEVLGHGSKRGIGRPVQAEHSLDLSGLSGVTLYEPEELVLSAKAGTPITEIEQLLHANHQELSFEPMDYGPALGGDPGRGTIGGVLAANLSGPRRIKSGAARDHVLGINAVSGRGEIFKSGGRVVKNVTGYDLSKGMAGSWGTLAVLTDVTFKVLPRPEHVETLALLGLEDGPAVATLCKAMGMPWEVSAAAHVPEDLATTLPVLPLARAAASATLIRLEGFPPSVSYRLDKLRDALSGIAEMMVIDAPRSEALWRAIRDALPLAGSDRPLWRLSVAPITGPAIVAGIRERLAIRHFYDWSGGLVWIEAGDDAQDGGAAVVRAAVQAAGGGHATLVRGSAPLRAAIPPFETQPEALAALSRRLKAQFDPKGILNPGRMVAGI